MHIIKNQRFICINENETPIINEDGSFQFIEIYRGFETQEAYESITKRGKCNSNKKAVKNKWKIPSL